MKEIQLSIQGKNKGLFVALVDDEDFEELNKFRWSVTRRKNINYAFRNLRIDGKRTVILMHNQIMNGILVDHILHNGCNNQHNNLRFCTTSQNQMNSSSNENSTSIYKGVCWCKSKKRWRAYITKDQKTIPLGYFRNEIEAAKKYDNRAIKLFGEFANINFKNGTL